MRFTIVNCDQRSDQWMAARLGRVTSSSANDMLAQGKGGAESAGRRNLRIRLVLERLTGRSQEKPFQSAAMAEGVEREPAALAAYQAHTGNLLSHTGALQHTELMAGASLDGHTDDFSLIVEAKSPLPATHFEYFKTGKVPTDYLRQVMHQLFITGADACDWFSWCPDFPEGAQIKLVTVTRNDVDLDAYERELRKFLAEVDTEVQAFRTTLHLSDVLKEAVA